MSTQPEKVEEFFKQLKREFLRDVASFLAVVEVCGFNDRLFQVLEDHRCQKVISVFEGQAVSEHQDLSQTRPVNSEHPTRSSLPMRPHKIGDLCDGFSRFRKPADVEHMYHPRPNLQCHGDSVSLRFLCDTNTVIPQHFVFADVN